MSSEVLVSELRDTLKTKESQLAKAESERDMLRHECNSLQDTIRIMVDSEAKT